MGRKMKLITSIACEILKANDFQACGPAGAQSLWKEAEGILHKKLRAMKPSTLGIIAASGRHSDSTEKTSLYYVHCGSYLGKHWGGKRILRYLAAKAIVAEMWDILVLADPQRAQPRLPKKFAD